MEAVALDAPTPERDTARAMSEENVEIVRWLIESNHSTDLADRLEEGLDRWAPDCVYVSRLGMVDQEIYHGHEGLRRYASDMTSAWSEWRNEPHEIVEVRPGVVLATFRVTLTGVKSGVLLENDGVAVFWFADGRIKRGQTYNDRAEALEAAGLSE